MKKRLLPALFTFFSVGFAFSQAPAFAWVKASASIPNPNVSPTGGIIVDTIHQYVYATGSFEGGINFGGGDIEPYGGAGDPYLVKYDLSGSLIWAKGFSSSDYNTATGVGVDNAGNVYITGYSQNDSIVFGSLFLLNSHPGSTDHTVGYVAKFDSNGNPIWLKGSAGGGGVICNAIAVDAAGNCFVTGHVFEDAGTFMGNSTSKGAFFARISSSGNLDWFKQTTPSAGLISQGTSIALDRAGNCVVCGAYANNISFGTIAVTHSGNGSWNRFATKLDGSTGAFVWATGNGNGSGADYAWDIATDLQNNIFVTGYTSIATPNGSNPYTEKQYIEKLNPSGVSQWMHGYDQTLLSLTSAVATDKYGNVFATYNISDTTVFGNYTVSPISPMFANTTIIMAIVKLDGAGNVLYTKSTTDPVVLSLCVANSIATDAGGNLYINGTISNECKFDNFDFHPESSHTEFVMAKLGNASNGNGGGGNGGGTVGIKQQDAAQQTTAYPNPAAKTLYIKNGTAGASVKINSLNGTRVIETTLADKTVSLDISGLASGVYVVEINTAGTLSHQKIIVNNN